MNTTDTIKFRSNCCGAEMKPLPEGHHLSQWHELKDNGESCLMAYGVCSKCNKLSEFREVK